METTLKSIFFKLVNNSVCGKTLENIRNSVDSISSDKVAQKLAAKSNYDRCTIFDENLIAVHMKKTKLCFNKPVYPGGNICLIVWFGCDLVLNDLVWYYRGQVTSELVCFWCGLVSYGLVWCDFKLLGSNQCFFGVIWVWFVSEWFAVILLRSG